MENSEEKLIKLAGATFADLTDTEKTLLKAATKGRFARCGLQSNLEDDSRLSDTWTKSHAIRAEVVRWLCMDEDAVRHIDPKGLLIEAAYIEQQLDLSSVKISRPLALRRCAIPAGINLERAETQF
jgi:hypothetical protein